MWEFELDLDSVGTDLREKETGSCAWLCGNGSASS